MKFVILRKYGEEIVDVDDFDEALWAAENNHTHWDDVMAIVKVEEQT